MFAFRIISFLFFVVDIPRIEGIPERHPAKKLILTKFDVERFYFFYLKEQPKSDKSKLIHLNWPKKSFLMPGCIHIRNRIK